MREEGGLCWLEICLWLFSFFFPSCSLLLGVFFLLGPDVGATAAATLCRERIERLNLKPLHSETNRGEEEEKTNVRLETKETNDAALDSAVCCCWNGLCGWHRSASQSLQYERPFATLCTDKCPFQPAEFRRSPERGPGSPHSRRRLSHQRRQPVLHECRGMGHKGG